MCVEAGAILWQKVEGSTALHIAVCMGSIKQREKYCLDRAKYLVEHGAEVNAKVLYFDQCLPKILNLINKFVGRYPASTTSFSSFARP